MTCEAIRLYRMSGPRRLTPKLPVPLLSHFIMPLTFAVQNVVGSNLGDHKKGGGVATLKIFRGMHVKRNNM
jgi:hypothetical protein